MKYKIIALAVLLSVFLGGIALGQATRYSDVEEGKWYSEPIAWVTNNGIMYGTSETAFSPEGTVTRAEMATILHRYQKYERDLARADLNHVRVLREELHTQIGILQAQIDKLKQVPTPTVQQVTEANHTHHPQLRDLSWYICSHGIDLINHENYRKNHAHINLDAYCKRWNR